MQTLSTAPSVENVINLINDLAFKSTFYEKRKCGELDPLTAQSDSRFYKGFLSDWSGDCRMNLYYALKENGFRTTKYEAPYFWAVTNGVIKLEYIEGDLYGTVQADRSEA